MMNTINILVAEDEDTDLFFIQEAFKKSSLNHKLYYVRNGQEAVDFVLCKGDYEDMPIPHIIIMDIKMPKKNGHEALKDIRSMTAFKHVPIIMISGSESPEDIQKSYDNFANAFLSKPDRLEDMSELIARVDSLLSESVSVH